MPLAQTELHARTNCISSVLSDVATLRLPHQTKTCSNIYIYIYICPNCPKFAFSYKNTRNPYKEHFAHQNDRFSRIPRKYEKSGIWNLESNKWSIFVQKHLFFGRPKNLGPGTIYRAPGYACIFRGNSIKYSI